MAANKLIHNLELSRPFVKDFDTICSPANVRSSSPGEFVVFSRNLSI